MRWTSQPNLLTKKSDRYLMRELEREPTSDTQACARLAIVGRGRLGHALTTQLRQAGVDVQGPLGRGADGGEADAVLLCVPDSEIPAAAAAIRPGRLVGHCSGAGALDLLLPHERFSLHPLMTVTRDEAEFAGAGAAVAGSSPRALQLATELAAALRMQPVELAEADRPAYHAAASMASNFLLTVEAAAESLAATAGVRRMLLVPLVRATVENWARQGAERALTGPIARGDESTVEAQRAAVAQRAGELLPLFDALVEGTRQLAGNAGAPGKAGNAAAPDSRPAAGRGGTRTVRTVAEIRGALRGVRGSGRSIGLVPTMGALHDGHLALIRRAREDSDVVVVSLFVNPAQFNDPGDLTAYPRDEQRDADLVAELGVDFLFAPPVSEVYPAGFSTTVTVGGVTERLEGRHRGRGHFDAVATVVTKLFNMVAPDVAYFGQKDAQQAVVIKRLVRDLDLPVRIEVCPTVREPDGLAMSSRNVHLAPDERARAGSLHHAMVAADQALAAGLTDPTAVTARAREALTAAGVEPEYLELVQADTLEPVDRVEAGVLAVVAARVGDTRLIDNQTLSATAADPGNDNGRP